MRGPSAALRLARDAADERREGRNSGPGRCPLASGGGSSDTMKIESWTFTFHGSLSP
jgi:hypothetical protein